MNRVFPFISVDNAADAIELYKRAFGAKEIGDRTFYREFYDDPTIKNKIAHVTLSIEDSPLFINDAYEQPNTDQSRFTVNVELSTNDKVVHAFHVLRETAQTIFYEPMNLGWSELGFSLKDAFGVLWMVYVRE